MSAPANTAADLAWSTSRAPSKNGRHSGLTRERWEALHGVLELEQRYARKRIAAEWGVSVRTLTAWAQLVRKGQRPKRPKAGM